MHDLIVELVLTVRALRYFLTTCEAAVKEDMRKESAPTADPVPAPMPAPVADTPAAPAAPAAPAVPAAQLQLPPQVVEPPKKRGRKPKVAQVYPEQSEKIAELRADMADPFAVATPPATPAVPAPTSVAPTVEQLAVAKQKCQEVIGLFIRRYLKATPPGLTQAKALVLATIKREIAKIDDLTHEEHVALIPVFEAELAKAPGVPAAQTQTQAGAK